MTYRLAGSANGWSEYWSRIFPIAVLQQEVQLPEHLGEIAAVDLVDDQEVQRVGLPSRSLGHVEQRPVSELEAGLPVDERGAEALDEVLVGVRRMKLHQPHALLRSSEARRQLLGDVGLPGTRRALQDDLPPVVQQTLNRAKVIDVDQEFFRECCNAWNNLVPSPVDATAGARDRCGRVAESIQQLERGAILWHLSKSPSGLGVDVPPFEKPSLVVVPRSLAEVLFTPKDV